MTISQTIRFRLYMLIRDFALQHICPQPMRGLIKHFDDQQAQSIGAMMGEGL